MFSFFTYLSLPSIYRPKIAKAIDIPPVRTCNIELEKGKPGRSLKYLLKLNHVTYSILYHDLQFHNHLPHLLGSAYLLGSDVTHIQDLYDKEAESLEKWEVSPGEVSKHDWKDFLGQRKYQRAFIDFFEDELVQSGYDWRKVVDTYLLQGKRPLLNNVISGLGHPLIHLGYAMELGSKEVAMEALGLAATCYNFMHKYIDEPLYSKPSKKKSASLLEILELVRKDDRFDGIFDGPGSEDMKTLFDRQEEAVLEYWNSWEITDPKQQFENSQHAAACLLSATVSHGNQAYDFFLVHTLTSSHAWWLLTLTVYITQLRPRIDPESVSTYDLRDRDWAWVEKIASEGKWSHDAHFVKALRALKEAAQTWGDEERFYLKAAVKFADQFTGWFGFAEIEGGH